MSQTYYDILGVTQTASFEEIKHAFRTKAKEYHPDYHPDDKDAERKFKEINEAYEVLKDAQKRATYDRVGHAAYTNGATGGFSPGFGGFGFSKSGFENIFDDVFNAFNGQRPHPSAINRGEDIRYNLAIDLGDAYFGAKKNITIDTFVKCPKCDGRGGKNLSTCPTCGGMGHVRQRQGFFIMETECPICHGTGKTVKDPCSDCKGAGRLRRKRTLEVSIPAGVDTGVRMRLTGEGNAALNGGEAGDLYIFLTITDHPLFKRDNSDLYCEVPVPMTTAALGGDIVVPTMDGKGSKATIQPGLQTGDSACLKGKGMPVLHAKTYGDMYLIYRVETPTNLTPKQRELLQEFDRIGGHKQSACEDFWDRIKSVWKNFKKPTSI